MKRFIKKNYVNFLIGLSALIFMWAVWFFAQILVKNEYVVPTFQDTIKALFIEFSNVIFWTALLRTLFKVLVAVILSFVLSLIFSVLGKVIKNSRAFFKPILAVLRTLPTMAILVLILIYTNRNVAPIIVASLVLFPLMYSQFNTAFDSVDDGLINAMKVFNLSKRQRIFKIYLPMVAPSVISNLGGNLSFGIKLIISAEIMANTYMSLGGLLKQADEYLQIPTLMALTLFSVILGLVIELVFHAICSYAFKWNKGEGKND